MIEMFVAVCDASAADRGRRDSAGGAALVYCLSVQIGHQVERFAIDREGVRGSVAYAADVIRLREGESFLSQDAVEYAVEPCGELAVLFWRYGLGERAHDAPARRGLCPAWRRVDEAVDAGVI